MTPSRRSLPSWRTLEALTSTLHEAHLRNWFSDNPQRFEHYSLEENGCLLDYSKHWISPPIWTALLDLARECHLPDRFEALCQGSIVNTTEGTAAFHTALRNFSNEPLNVNHHDVRTEVEAERARMLALATELHEGRYLGSTGEPITHVVNIGIGGSDLGPRSVIEGLKPYHGRHAPHILTLASIDGDHLHSLLAGLDPTKTLFLIVSKSLGTQETRLNAERARAWLIQHLGIEAAARHFVAITANTSAAQKEFGIPPERCLQLWPWVSGRYSLWSSVGFSIAVRLGAPAFLELLQGAHAMDQHARTAPIERNMPAIMALLGVWYSSFLGISTHAVVPYPERLDTLVAHLKQLEMESNGKRISVEGHPVDIPTAPIIWGGPGNQGQHAYFQLLHQGTQHTPIDFILEARPHHNDLDLHQHLIANALAQSQALMTGTDPDGDIPDYQRCPGHQPSTTLFFDQLTPFNVGRLLALYEHKVAMQGILWNINSFDQWGVALGKKLASNLESLLLDPSQASRQDASTQGLLRFFLQHHSL